MDSVEVEWEGRIVEATVPPLVADWEIALSPSTIRRTADAAAAVRSTGRRGSGQSEVVARLLLRTEGLASSAIEGLQASATDVCLAESVGAAAPGGPTASWVADNLAVVTSALRHRGELDVPTLLAWHRRLMRHTATLDEHQIGVWRSTLGWVGGASPRLAAHVAPPAELVPSLMDDLMAFAARDDLDPITHAGVLHAQFETIHPFADGNGRIGRVLVGWLLARRLDVEVPPPVSGQMARDVGGYQAGLTLYRQDAHDRWVAWFADAVAAAADAAADTLTSIDGLVGRWRQDLAGLRSDATARRIVELLPAHPVISASLVVREVGVSHRAAAGALAELARRGVLSDAGTYASGRGRPQRWWVASALLASIGR